MSEHHPRCNKRWHTWFGERVGAGSCPTCRALRTKEGGGAFSDEPLEVLEYLHAPRGWGAVPASRDATERHGDRPAHEAIQRIFEELAGGALTRQPTAEETAERTIEEVDGFEWHAKAAWRAGYDYVDVLVPDGDFGSGMTDEYDIRVANEGDAPVYLRDPAIHVRRFSLADIEPEDVPTLSDKTNGAEDAPEDRGASPREEFLFGEDRAGAVPDSGQHKTFGGGAEWSEADHPSTPSDPEVLGPCVHCGHPVAHDELAAEADFRFNCHGGWLDDPSRDDGLYHHRCLLEVLYREHPPAAWRVLRQIEEIASAARRDLEDRDG